MNFLSKKGKLNEIVKLYTEPESTFHMRIIELLSQYLDRFYFEKIKKETEIISYLGTIPLKKFSSSVHFRKPVLDVLYFDLMDQQNRPHTLREYDPMIFHFNQIWVKLYLKNWFQEEYANFSINFIPWRKQQ